MTDKVKSNNKTIKSKEKTKKEVKVRGRKINSNQKSVPSTRTKKGVKNTSKDSKLVVTKREIINKVSITYLLLLIFDIVLTVCMARGNVINYVVILNKKIRLGNLVYLLLGRNYVNVIIMIFMYSYTCLVNKFFLKRKNNIKFLSLLLITVVALNLLLFFVFSNKVY